MNLGMPKQAAQAAYRLQLQGKYLLFVIGYFAMVFYSKFGDTNIDVLGKFMKFKSFKCFFDLRGQHLVLDFSVVIV